MSAIAENRRRLYEVSKPYFDNLGTFEEFDARMNNADNRAIFHKAAKPYFTNLGSLEEFTERICGGSGGVQDSQSAQRAQSAQEGRHSVSPTMGVPEMLRRPEGPVVVTRQDAERQARAVTGRYKVPSGEAVLVTKRQELGDVQREMSGMLSGAEDEREIRDSRRYRALWLRERELRDQVEAIEDGNKERNGGWAPGSLGRGVMSTLGRLSTWDFGAEDYYREVSRAEIKARLDRGESLTPEEEAAVREEARTGGVVSAYGDNSGWYRWGAGAGASAPYMLDFVLTGGISGVLRGGSKLAAKFVGKEAMEAMAKTGVRSYIKEGGARALGNEVVRGLGVLGDDLIHAGIITAVPQGLKTASAIQGQMTGEATVDGEGNVGYEGGKSLGAAIYEGVGDALTENFSEMLGNHLPGFTSLAGELAGKVGAGKVSRFLLAADGSQLAALGRQTRAAFRKAGVSNLTGEVMEEYLGQGIRTALGLESARTVVTDADGNVVYERDGDGNYVLDESGNPIAKTENNFMNLQWHGDTWATMAVFMGAMGAAKGVYTAHEYRQGRSRVKRADAQGEAIFGNSEWTAMRDIIDNVDNEHAGALAETIMHGEDYSADQREAALNYLGAVLLKRGSNLGAVANSRSSQSAQSTPSVQEGLVANYDEGYNAGSDEERREVGLEYGATRAEAAAAAGLDGADVWEWLTDRYEQEDEHEVLQSISEDNDLGDEVKESLGAFLGARMHYRGAVDALNDEMEAEKAKVMVIGERGSHRGTGMIHAGRLYNRIEGAMNPELLRQADAKQDGPVVFIVDGHVESQGETGEISRGESDDTLLVYDPESKEERFVPLSDLAVAYGPVDREAFEEMHVSRLEQEAAERIESMGNYLPGESSRSSQSTQSIQSAPTGEDEMPDFESGDTFMVNVAGHEESQPAAIMSREGEIVDVWSALPLNDTSEKAQTLGGYVTKIDRGALAGLVSEGSYQRAEGDESSRRAQSSQSSQSTQEERHFVSPTVEASAQKVEDGMPMRELRERGHSWQEPDYMAVSPERSHRYIYEESGLSRQEAGEHVAHMLKSAKDAVEKHSKGAPKIGGSIARYQQEKEQWKQQGEELQRTVDYWDAVAAEQRKVTAAERAEREAQEARAHEEAVARFEEEQRIKAEKAAEQARIGVHAVHPKIRERWESSPKIAGSRDVLRLPDGSTIKGQYVLTEAGAATASHDPENAYEPTEGFPVDENGQSVNDRDYQRDVDAQRIVEDMAGKYDSRALQDPVIVSHDGVVLSGNNRTMSGDIAARQGTDGEYVGYLRDFGHGKYGFTSEQVSDMKNPRVVFVPEESLPYDAATFARFNAQEKKSQSKPEAAVKLGKVVPDGVFNQIVRELNQYERLSDYYGNEKAAAQALGALHQAGVINEVQMPELRTGTSLSAAGRELLENTLIGKVFQEDPDAVRKIMEIPTMRQAILMSLAEIANNRSLSGKGYDLTKELSKAVDLCYRAKTRHPEIYTQGVPVSPFGRMQGLFDDEYGDSRVSDATTLLLADLLNDTKPSRLRNVMAVYNKEGTAASAGSMDLFTGDVASKETILTEINNHFNNGTPQELQSLVEAAVAARRAAAEQGAAESGDGIQVTEQTEPAVQGSEGDGGRLKEGDAKGVNNVKDVNKDKAEQSDTVAERSSQGEGEIDENGYRFVVSPNGTTTFGEIHEESGLSGAPIKLSQGYQNSDGKGYGLQHIEATHGDQIRGAGFSSVEEFVSFVATNYDEDNIRVGKQRRNGNTTYLIQASDQYDNTLFIELSRDRSYWNVNSGGIFRKGYSNKKETVAKTEPQQPNNANSDDSSLSAELKNGINSVEPNGKSTVSEGKGNTILSEKQEAGAEEMSRAIARAEDVGAPISEKEKDEFGLPFIIASDGSTTFGYIEPESGLSPAPIRLSLGKNRRDENGKNIGYGFLHIEAGHGNQIRNAGFPTVEEFVENVARNYTTIREGSLIGNRQTYLLEVSDDHNNTLFIQLSRDGKYWNINSAGIFKKKYSRNKAKVYSLPAVGNGKDTDTIEVNSGQSKGATAPAGNSSETSEGKGNTILSEKQEGGAEDDGRHSVSPTVESGDDQKVIKDFKDDKVINDIKDGDVNDDNYIKQTDKQGNPIDKAGKLIVENVNSISEITDEDFMNPQRNVGLPALIEKVSNAIGAEGRSVIIKRNIFEKNHKSHKDLTPEDSRKILNEVLYNPNLYGQNQKEERPYNWILVHLSDKNSAIIIEVNPTKDHLEVVNWHYLNGRQLEQKKRQAEREGGRILTLQESNAVGNTSQGLSSEGKGNTILSEKQEAGAEELAEAIAQAEGEVDVNPTEGQKETILTEINNHFNNGTPQELQSLVEAAVAARRAAAEQGSGEQAAERGSGNQVVEEAEHAVQGSEGDGERNPLGENGNRNIDEWFGPIYTQFQGNAKAAEEYLQKTFEGVAKGAIIYPGLAPIDLVWGDKKAGYMKILIKHPEVAGKIQDIIDECKITTQSENRIILESDGHKVIISKMKGNTPTDNWLLTAYEKKEKPASASSSDIETEPEGKRNGTATPQNGLSEGKGNTILSEKQEGGAEDDGRHSVSPTVESGDDQKVIKDFKDDKEVNAEIAAREDKDVKLMGSRTAQKMNAVGDYYAGQEMDANTQAVVDVYAGKVQFLKGESGVVYGWTVGGKEGEREYDLEEISEQFDLELNKYSTGNLTKGHRFQLGMPSVYLRSAGFPALPISMRSSLLSRKSGDEKHPFEAKELKGLVNAIQKPIAVFEYSKANKRNLIVDVTHNGKHFLVGVTLNYKSGDIEINSVSGLFPKENHEWIKWIQAGKAIRIDQKEKVQGLIDSLRTNPAESERIGLNLDDVAKIVKDFENPSINDEIITKGGDKDFNDGNVIGDNNVLGEKDEASRGDLDGGSQSQEGIEYRTAEEGIAYYNARSIEPWSERLDKLRSKQRETGSLHDGNNNYNAVRGRDLARLALPAIARRREDLVEERPQYSAAGQAAIDEELADLEYMTLYYERMAAGEDVERTMPGRVEHQRMLATARRVAASLGVDVVLYEAPGDIEDSDRERLERKRGSYGWYNPNDGTVHINVGRHTDSSEIARTVLHEVVGHKSIEELMGVDRFNRLIDEIWNHAGEKVRSAIARKMQKHGWDYREATKEYLAELAEEVDSMGFEQLEKEQQSLWSRIKAKVADFLNRILEGAKIPAHVKLTDKDLSYMMWKVYKHQQRKAAGKAAEGDIFDKAEEIVKREEWKKSEGSLEIAARAAMSSGVESFANQRARAVAEKGIVMPGLNEKSVRVVEVARHDFGGDKPISEARQWARSHIVGEHELTDSEGSKVTYTISKRAVDKYLSQSSIDKSDNLGVHLSVLKQLPEVIGESIEAEIHPDYNKGEDGVRRESEGYKSATLIHRFYGAVNIDGTLYRVKTTVVEDSVEQKNKPHSYEVSSVELTEDSAGQKWSGRHGTTSTLPRNSESSYGSSRVVPREIIRGAKLLQGVEKSYESGVKLLEASEKGVVDGLKGGTSFRPQSEAGLEFRDGGESIADKTLNLALMLSERHQHDISVRDSALESLGKRIGNLSKAMSAQQEYDYNTVRSLVSVADILITREGFLPEGPGEIKRLVGLIQRGVGHSYTSKSGDTKVEHVTQSEEDFKEAAESLMDLFTDNQLKLAGRFLDEVIKLKGSKVNARGVEVAGKLDVEGQLMVRGFKSYMGTDLETIRARKEALEEQISQGTELVSINAAAERLGVELAEEYVNEVTWRVAEEKIMRDDLRDMKSRWDPKLSGEARKAYIEQKRAIRESIRQKRIERADAMRELASRIGNELRNSIERVKEYRAQEKERIEEIRHNANSDMSGRPFAEHGKHKAGVGEKLSNNAIARIILAPAATFEQMMRVLGKKSIQGEGYLYDRFVRGWQQCRDREWQSTQAVEKVLDAKAAELLGMKKARWSDLYKLSDKHAGNCEWLDGGEMLRHDITQGNLMYLYMVNKMTDGRVKLRAMGITDEKIAEATVMLDSRLKAAADWLQEEFLPTLRERYNAVHERMFGASMASIDNYFPLKILSNARVEEVEMSGKIDGNDLPKTMTGAIIKRKYNRYALDIVRSDAVSVALDHIREMETWAAFAEYRRDLCTLLSYKHFRNQIKNMKTIYGSGEKLWEKFYDLSLLVGGAYKPKVSDINKAAVNITKLATGACIAIRLNTALKQLLSYPAFMSEANIGRLLWNISPFRWKSCWDWAIKNMPSFERRWKSRLAGNEVLRKWDHDWDWTRNEFVQKLQRAGITPNAFIDGITVACGAEAVYRSKYKGYLKDCHNKVESHKRAVEDAEIIFNLSQQSSELPYLSLLQNDRSYLSMAVTNFRNSPMSYLRQIIQSMRELINMSKGKDVQMSFEIKKGMREGLTREQAKSRAERMYRHNIFRNIVKVSTFWYILPALWAYGLTGIWYAIFGDDDDKKKADAEDALKRGSLGLVEGLTFGGTLPDWLYGTLTGTSQELKEESSPAIGLFTEVANLLSKGKIERSAHEMINTLVACGAGINPQVIEDVVAAGMDYFGEDERSSRDFALLFMRVLSCPQSQIDAVYFDELGLSGAEAQKKTPAELAERYAIYKARRSNMGTLWAYDDRRWDREALEPWRKRFRTEAKARFFASSDKAFRERWDEMERDYKDVGAEIEYLSDKLPLIEASTAVNELYSTERGQNYLLMKHVKPRMDKLLKLWFEAEDSSTAAQALEAAGELRREIINNEQ